MCKLPFHNQHSINDTERPIEVPQELRLHIAKDVVLHIVDDLRGALIEAEREYDRRWIVPWPYVSLSFTHDGFPSSITLARKDGFADFLRRVFAFQDISEEAHGVSQNPLETRFWSKISPFRFIRHVDMLLGWSGYVLDAGYVAEIGAAVRVLSHLHSLTLRTSDMDPLCNGVVQWPPHLGINSVHVHLLGGHWQNEWKRPFFPFTFHPFPNLAALSIQTDISTHNSYDRAPKTRIELHPEFSRRMSTAPHTKFRPKESIDVTLVRLSTDYRQVCKAFMQLTASEQSYIPHERREVTTTVVCRYDSDAEGRWDVVARQKRRTGGSIPQEDDTSSHLQVVGGYDEDA